MTLLVLGVVLWATAHLFKRVLPDVRAGMGDKGRGPVALALLASVLLMIFGFRMAPHIDVWYPESFLRHINNLLVLIAIFLMSPAPRKGKLFNNMRHPQLTGFGLWAFAHLLVNGDVASLILFGGLLLWAVLEIVVINRAEPDWTPTETGSIAKDGMFLVASLVLMAAIGWVHAWLGYPVFGG